MRSSPCSFSGISTYLISCTWFWISILYESEFSETSAIILNLVWLMKFWTIFTLPLFSPLSSFTVYWSGPHVEYPNISIVDDSHKSYLISYNRRDFPSSASSLHALPTDAAPALPDLEPTLNGDKLSTVHVTVFAVVSVVQFCSSIHSLFT